MFFDLNARIARAKQTRLGLTLIELIVVLVILIGLGGLLAPTINNALTRTHVSTCAVSFPEVHSMMQRVQVESGNFGTGFDSGIYATTSDPVNNSTTTFGLTQGGGNGATGPLSLQVQDLTADEAAALARVGITNVFDHTPPTPADPDYNVTFNIFGTSRDLATGGAAITLTPEQAQLIFLPTGNGQKYVWFGIGRNWSLLSELAAEPPVHFGDAFGALADQVHSRFGIIMQVAEAGGALEKAEYKRVSYCVDGEVFETGDNHIENYYKEVNPRGA
ncbi:MAG: type II secretion system protein [Planctomycetota bacterium]